LHKRTHLPFDHPEFEPVAFIHEASPMLDFCLCRVLGSDVIAIFSKCGTRQEQYHQKC